eukprot:gnl/Dysnectes_brevis/3611_a4596_530.p1 GENE.gnl/Dysnectes_brevis/3611_a4596_530~~gnl/Dysnectes_brevis/3611_a4596_530.p1  ORF type:complete len:717 (-),score=136.94 gnl/Dysnectes_brevis/3611_a4596_530:110-2260(-)
MVKHTRLSAYHQAFSESECLEDLIQLSNRLSENPSDERGAKLVKDLIKQNFLKLSSTSQTTVIGHFISNPNPLSLSSLIWGLNGAFKEKCKQEHEAKGTKDAMILASSASGIISQSEETKIIDSSVPFIFDISLARGLAMFITLVFDSHHLQYISPLVIDIVTESVTSKYRKFIYSSMLRIINVALTHIVGVDISPDKVNGKSQQPPANGKDIIKITDPHILAVFRHQVPKMIGEVISVENEATENMLKRASSIFVALEFVHADLSPGLPILRWDLARRRKKRMASRFVLELIERIELAQVQEVQEVEEVEEVEDTEDSEEPVNEVFVDPSTHPVSQTPSTTLKRTSPPARTPTASLAVTPTASSLQPASQKQSPVQKRTDDSRENCAVQRLLQEYVLMDASQSRIAISTPRTVLAGDPLPLALHLDLRTKQGGAAAVPDELTVLLKGPEKSSLTHLMAPNTKCCITLPGTLPGEWTASTKIEGLSADCSWTVEPKDPPGATNPVCTSIRPPKGSDFDPLDLCELCKGLPVEPSSICPEGHMACWFCLKAHPKKCVCGSTVQRHKLPAMLHRQLSKQSFSCPLCTDEVPMTEWSAHLLSCPAVLFSCGNCKENVRRDEFETHQKSCSVVCPTCGRRAEEGHDCFDFLQRCPLCATHHCWNLKHHLADPKYAAVHADGYLALADVDESEETRLGRKRRRSQGSSVVVSPHSKKTRKG